ncbi:hypothetical protein [Lysinibacillus contaminans]|uniref:hypothetical protein n=1 Tax=Lysinibacillus contaminans TaxID=1293441 RepID=UPI0006B02554|nr:hypothetical protein [Lysinibacillus contaminans]
MKKIFWCILMGILLVACQNEDITKTKGNTIMNAQLTKREENLLKAAAGEIIFTYDVTVDERGGQLDVWLEKYEYGQLSDDSKGGVGTEIFEDRQILVSVRKVPESRNAIVRTSVIGESYIGTGENLIELPDSGASGHSSLLPAVTTLTEDMAIGQIIYAEDTLSFQTSWGDLNNNPAALVSELKDYPVVYLVRCSFKEAISAESSEH